VRRITSETLAHVAAKDIGAADLVASGAVQALIRRLHDDDAPVAAAAFNTLEATVAWVSGRTGLAGTRSALGALVALLADEREADGRLHQALRVLRATLAVDHNDDAIAQIAVRASGVPVICALLAAPRPAAVRNAAAHVLAALCAGSPEAAAAAVAAGAVPHLSAMLHAGPYDARLAASAALGYVTVILPGKHAVKGCKPDAIMMLIRLLAVSDETLCENLLQVVANVAELPANRKELRAQLALPALDELAAGEGALLMRERALAVVDGVKFQHHPHPVKRYIS
jgi:hypothetical protein